MSATSVSLYGNLTNNPELRYTANGKALASFTVAENTIRKDGSKGETMFYDVTVWDAQAENVSTSLHKGDRVVVLGRLRQERWEKDGQRRTKVSITAEDDGLSLRWATATATRTQPKAQQALSDDDLDDLLV